VRPALIRSVVNQSRQNKPAIKVSPVDNGADVETSEVISGLVRSIERNSNAEVAYDTAIDNAVTGGMGFFRIGIDYAHDETFDMECTIDRIPNALMVNYDVRSTAFDASDWEYAFISDLMNEEDYENRYPGASKVPFESDRNSDTAVNWMYDDQIRVAEYFLRTEKTRQLVQLAVRNPQTGETDLQAVRLDQLPEMARRFFEAGNVPTDGMSDDELVRGFMEVSGVEERRRRDVKYHEVMRRIINGVEVLEEETWPGSTIPICPVWGDEVYLDGRRNFRSMIRDAKDPQMMFNFWRSATTELVALAPKAPWVGPTGFVPKGQEAKWDSANTRNHSYLEYNKDVGAPTRLPFAGVPAGSLQEAMNANDDMKAITGIFDSSIGAQSNETSGKAILARERQGDVSNFHFIDNLSRAIRYAGQVLVEIIPSVYSARETIRILGEDQAQNVIQLTQEAGGAYRKGIEGQPELYNLSVGKYDVTVSTGPSYGTQREETRETLIEIMRQVPDAAPFIGDVLMNHMDFVGADKIAKRLNALLPQAIRDTEGDEGFSDNPEAAELKQQLQAKDQEMQQAQEAVMAEIKRLTDENEAAKADKQAEMQRTQMDGAAKMKELQIKEGELALKAREPVVTPEQKWAYDRQIESDKMAFEADQNDKDRQVDLAKAILAKQPTEATEAVETDNDGAETAMAMAMIQAAEMMAAPKAVVRDPITGQIVGIEPVVPDVTVVTVEEDVMQ
jgi:hypothetical protein